MSEQNGNHLQSLGNGIYRVNSTQRDALTGQFKTGGADRARQTSIQRSPRTGRFTVVRRPASAQPPER